MNKAYPAVMGLLMASILLGGCAAEVTAPMNPVNGASQGGAPSSPSAMAGTVEAPSAATSMVCSAEAKDSVTKILGLSSTPATTISWDGQTYTCNYSLAAGPFSMTVKVMPGDAQALAEAKKLATSLAAPPVVGLSNLGLSGYQSAGGDVVFAKDNMVLHVDGTAMSATVGQNKISRTDFAFQMATTILACWTEH